MWLKLHDTARDHPKIRKLAAVLNINRAQALGHLAMLWLWVIKDGDLSGKSIQEIANAAYWMGDPEQFLEALVLVRLVDREAGQLCIHDAADYAGSVKETQRKARLRAGRRDSKTGMSRDKMHQSRDIQKMSQDMSRDKSIAVSRDIANDSGNKPHIDSEIENKLDELFPSSNTTH